MRKNFNALENFSKISQMLKEEGINESSKKGSAKLLKELREYLGCENDMEVMIFTSIMALGYTRQGDSGICNIANFLKIDVMKMLSYKKEIDKLKEHRLIETKRIKHYNPLDGTSLGQEYTVNKEITEAILNNEEIDKNRESKEIDCTEFVRMVSDQIEMRDNERITTRELMQYVEDLENDYKEMEMVRKVKASVELIEDRVIFYETCDDAITCNFRDTCIESTLNDIFEKNRDVRTFANSIMDGKNILVKEELIEVNSRGLLSDATMTLSDKGFEVFLGEDAKLYTKKKNNLKGVIEPETITAKNLYYDEKTQKQLDSIRGSLEEEKFSELTERLERMGMKKGVAILFYGGPGTGKTENVYQIAKATGRKILHVDISQTKSCWFGESEKMIKKVFSSYRAICKNEEKKPILLFNEADAVLSKRKNSTASSVSQTENAMQNIILEEMENLDGIMIATTNLADNLDAAFERRFLFKLKFEKPSIEAKTKIWKDKMSWLGEEDAKTLAERYEFSGGEIDNIVRKATMEEIRTGVRPAFDELNEICSNEKINKNGTARVGY